MSEKPKLLFDECLGFPLVQQLATLLGLTGEEAEVGHAIQMGFGGIDDSVWIPQIAADGWIVVTSDRGAQSRGGKQKLPTVCRQFGVTHVMLGRSVAKRNSYGKVRALVEVWDSLLTLGAEPRGAGFSIRVTGNGRATLVKLYDPA